jgi:hypothetical protein
MPRILERGISPSSDAVGICQAAVSIVSYLKSALLTESLRRVLVC